MTEPIKKHKKRWWLIGIIALSALILLLLFKWFKDQSQANNTDSALPRVPAMQLRPNTRAIALILPSSAQAWHITPIWARTNGYLLRYHFDIGDVVKEGDLLAEIDTPEVDQQYEQAVADLLNSMSLLDIAKITSDRWQKLWDKNPQAVTKQEVDQYNANFSAAQASVLSNEKNMSRLRYLQQFKQVYAPFNGIITQRNIDLGSLIYGNINEPPQELFQLAQTYIIRFFVQVPQNYYRQIEEGLKAEVTIQEFPDRIFEGLVTRYAKALDPTARTLLTEVDVENEDGMIYTGLFARVKFLLKPEYINFIIPTTAVIFTNSFPHVATIDKDNRIRLKQVQIGRDYGKDMEITHGLQEGELIVTIPSDRIREGAEVQIIEPLQQSLQAPPTGRPPAA